MCALPPLVSILGARRRHQRQLFLELRRGGGHRQPRRGGAAPAAGAPPACLAALLAFSAGCPPPCPADFMFHPFTLALLTCCARSPAPTQMRNYHLALMLSQGTPMLLMGEDVWPRSRHDPATAPALPWPAPAPAPGSACSLASSWGGLSCHLRVITPSAYVRLRPCR